MGEVPCVELRQALHDSLQTTWPWHRADRWISIEETQKKDTWSCWVCGVRHCSCHRWILSVLHDFWPFPSHEPHIDPLRIGKFTRRRTCFSSRISAQDVFSSSDPVTFSSAASCPEMSEENKDMPFPCGKKSCSFGGHSPEIVLFFGVASGHPTWQWTIRLLLCNCGWFE